MLGDLRQMCKQFIQQQQFIPLSLSLSLSLPYLFVYQLHYSSDQYFTPRPGCIIPACAVSVLVFPICRSCVAVVAYVSMLAHELQCVQRNGQVKSHYIVD